MAKSERAVNTATEAGVCPSCGAGFTAGAKFCRACGAGLAAGPDGTNRAGGKRISAGKGIGGLLVGWGVALVVSAAAVTGLVVYSVPGGGPGQPAPQASSAGSAPAPVSTPPSRGALPDLSGMTPREAADRLFNRVMTASENGMRAEALQFAPMAVAAYGGLPALDRDAHFHLGLIHGVTGDSAAAAREVAALKDGAPNHLLALILEYDAAERAGDRAAASRAAQAFAAAYPAEIAIPRPEYAEHRNVIEGFRTVVAGK